MASSALRPRVSLRKSAVARGTVNTRHGSCSILWPGVRRESRVCGTTSSLGAAALVAAGVTAVATLMMKPKGSTKSRKRYRRSRKTQEEWQEHAAR